MLQHWRANADHQVILDTSTLTSVSGTWQSIMATKTEPRSQSASEILSVCVNRLGNTDMATCAL